MHRIFNSNLQYSCASITLGCSMRYNDSSEAVFGGHHVWHWLMDYRRSLQFYSKIGTVWLSMKVLQPQRTAGNRKYTAKTAKEPCWPQQKRKPSARQPQPSADKIFREFKVNNAEAIQTLYKHYNNSETMERPPMINEILVWFWRFARNFMTLIQLANCCIFVSRRQETFVPA